VPVIISRAGLQASEINPFLYFSQTGFKDSVDAIADVAFAANRWFAADVVDMEYGENLRTGIVYCCEMDEFACLMQ
jgi:hypothetical protein